MSRERDVDRERDVERDFEGDWDGDIDVDVDHDYYDGWGGGWFPGAGLAWTATAVAVGTIVASIPPTCSTLVVEGVSYSECDGTWYQPQYAGTSVQYVVVDSPP